MVTDYVPIIDDAVDTFAAHLRVKLHDLGVENPEQYISPENAKNLRETLGRIANAANCFASSSEYDHIATDIQNVYSWLITYPVSPERTIVPLDFSTSSLGLMIGEALQAIGKTDDYMTIQDAAATLGDTSTWVNQLIYRRKISVVIIRGRYMVPRDQILEHLQQSTQKKQAASLKKTAQYARK